MEHLKPVVTTSLWCICTCTFFTQGFKPLVNNKCKLINYSIIKNKNAINLKNQTFYGIQLAEVLFSPCTYMKELDVLPVWPLKGTQIISAIQLCYLKYPQSPIAEDFNWSLWTAGRWQRVKCKSKVSQVERTLKYFNTCALLNHSGIYQSQLPVPVFQNDLGG